MPLTRINGTQIAENSITAEDIVYSLDDAYDNGGSGTGRTITADAGAVIIDGTASSIALEVTGNIRATGTVSSLGNLQTLQSIGDEGGEIFLNKPVTNTTLTNGVTIDVYQNKLRFFEAGGTARGYYVDITNGGATAGTNLASGGATPGGSDTFVQFNDGGTTFGGDAGLTYNKTTDSLTVAGDITGSNLRLTGDLAVIGGDLTSTSASFNIVNSGVTTVNLGGGASAVNIGAASSVTALAGDLNIGGGGSKARFGTSQQLQMLWNTNAAISNASGQMLLQQQAANQRLELHTSGTTAASMLRVRNFTTNNATFRDLLEVRNDGTIMIGSASSGPTFLGSTTVMNDLFLASGILAVSTDTTPIQLVSSGNVTVKLDVNNNSVGHKFAVQDWRGIDQFSVGENGNSEISGSLVISGSTSLGTTVERLLTSTGGTGVVSFDTTFSNIFYVNNPSGDITANFTNVPTTNNRIITPTVILSQSSTARTIAAVQVDGVGVTPINWANGVTPTATANKQNVFGFSLIRSGSVWTALGQMSTYG